MEFRRRAISTATWITFVVTVLGLMILAGPTAAQASPRTSAGAWGVATKAPVSVGSQACAAPGYCVMAAAGPSVLVARNGTGVWGKPIPLNTTALDPEDPGSVGASISFLACPSAGNCSVVGRFSSKNCFECLFGLNERNFAWGKAEPIAGLAQIGDDLGASLQGMACSSPGDCVAGGFFDSDEENTSGGPFVFSDQNGTWGSAEVLPGTENSNGGYVGQLSCAPGGDCLADGYNAGPDGRDGYFVAIAHNGTWGNATRLAGTKPLTYIGQIACTPHNTCTLVVPGSVRQSTSTFSETNGKWGPRRRVPGTIGLSFGELACPAAGDCMIAMTNPVAFATQRNGTWSKPVTAPGVARGAHTNLDFLACPAAGNCEAGGTVTSGPSSQQAFLVSERPAGPGKVGIVRGLLKLDGGGPSTLDSLACASAGHCVADGSYGPADPVFAGFLVSEP